MQVVWHDRQITVSMVKKDMNMNNAFFDSWHQWKVCFLAGCKEFWWGLMRIISCILLGILSVLRALWRGLVVFVSHNPKVAIGGTIVVAFIVWLVTFASMRARAVGAESQRDSISYAYYQFKTGKGYE
jgi:hypothetical protein